jgi:hypothetical protein
MAKTLISIVRIKQDRGRRTPAETEKVNGHAVLLVRITSNSTEMSRARILDRDLPEALLLPHPFACAHLNHVRGGLETAPRSARWEGLSSRHQFPEAIVLLL